MASNKNGTLLHWFRYDLRLHDMPSLSAALQVSYFSNSKCYLLKKYFNVKCFVFKVP